MRILFLAPFTPSHERPDALHHPRLLARHHDVTVVVLYRHASELSDLRHVDARVRRTVPLRLTRADSAGSCATRALTRWPLYLAYYYNRRLASSIADVVAETRPDVVHAHTLRMAPYAADAETPLRVCNIQDVLTTRYRGYVRRPSAGWPIDAEEYWKLSSFEPRLWRQMHRVGVVSEEEAGDANEVLPGLDASIIRPGIDPVYFAPLPDGERTRTLVFLGRFSYRPNVDAALRAATRVLPLVRRRCPDVRLALVGSDPPKVLRSLGRDRSIQVTGRVDDVRPWIGRAAASISPMSVGGGVKYKVLQSLAMATPVVTNALGARGTGLRAGHEYLQAESDEAMADACVEMLADERRRRELGAAGREAILARHSWDVIGDALEDFHRT